MDRVAGCRRASSRRRGWPASPARGADAAVSRAVDLARSACSAPVTARRRSIGSDQLHWAQSLRHAPGTRRTSQDQASSRATPSSDPAKASVVAQSMASNAQHRSGHRAGRYARGHRRRPDPEEGAAFAFVSGSATNVSLTDGKLRGYFSRVVPNDGVQAPTAANYMIKQPRRQEAARRCMIVDDQESYSTGPRRHRRRRCTGKSRRDGRPRVGQPEDDGLLFAGRQGGRPRRRSCSCRSSSSQAQLFAQQLKSQGKSAVAFGSDGTFDSKKFNVSGSCVSLLRSRRDDDRGQSSAIAAAVQQGVPGRHEPVPALPTTWPRSSARATATAGVQGRQDHPHRAPPGGREGESLATRSSASRCRSPRTATSPARSSSCSRSPTGSTRPSRSSFADGAVASAPHRTSCCIHAASMNWNLFVTELVAGINARQRLCADRPRLLDGVRDPEAAQLRPRRRLHGRRVHRLRRAHG